MNEWYYPFRYNRHRSSIECTLYTHIFRCFPRAISCSLRQKQNRRMNKLLCWMSHAFLILFRFVGFGVDFSLVLCSWQTIYYFLLKYFLSRIRPKTKSNWSIWTHNNKVCVAYYANQFDLPSYGVTINFRNDSNCMYSGAYFILKTKHFLTVSNRVHKKSCVFFWKLWMQAAAPIYSTFTKIYVRDTISSNNSDQI